jgi:hypothetical protein
MIQTTKTRLRDATAGMLGEELARCEEALSALNHALAAPPRGSLSVRKKAYKGREYRYPPPRHRLMRNGLLI